MPRSRPKPCPRAVVGYVRASTDDQRLGPEAQLAELRRWCEREGAELVAVHEDQGVSGAAPLEKRPGLLAALDALREHGAAVLLVAKRDRLARDVVVAAMVERLAERGGAQVLAADGTGNGDGPEAQLMRNIVSAFAAYERELIRVRTRAALAAKAERGERVGGKLALGLRAAPCGDRVEPEPSERAALARMVDLRREGTSIRAIAERLNAEGIAARGSRWHPTTVARALRRLDVEAA